MTVTAELEPLLARFPKLRPAMSEAVQAVYEKQYIENRAGDSTAASAAQRLERWMHRQVARDASPAKATLELGAGNLNQLPFEPEGGVYDVVEPFTALLAASRAHGRVGASYVDIAEVPAEARYDRITSIAVLEHVCDLPLMLARAARRLKPGGVLRAAIPSEGGLLWRLGWSLTTGLEFRMRYGLDYREIMSHEHVNTAAEIEALVRGAFEDVTVRSFGLGRQLSLYRYIEARRPREDVVAAWERRFAG